MKPGIDVKRDGRVSIVRRDSGDTSSNFHIQIIDQTSGVEFVDVEISAADLALALSGRSHIPCQIITRGLHLVGSVLQVESRLLQVPEFRGKYDDRHKFYQAWLDRDHSADGWRGDAADCSNGHKREVVDKKFFQRVTFRRHVNPFTGAPIVEPKP